MRHLAWKAHGLRALALGLVCAAAPAFALNYDGTLDTSLYSITDGIIPGLFRYGIDLGGGAPYYNYDAANAMLVQPNGKIMVAGFSWNNYLGTDQNACVLARFNVDGAVDTGFGSGGRVVQNFNPSSGENSCYLWSVALQGDGKIVVVGNIADASHGERALIERFNADGSTDSSFNSSGYEVMGDHTAFASVLVDTDGTLYAAGHYIVPNASDNDFYLAVFDAGGNFDYTLARAFDLGTGNDHDDRAYAQVLRFVPAQSCGVSCLIPAHSELYLVGTANNTPYSDLANHDCAIIAYRRAVTDTQFSLDMSFNGTGAETIDFPMASNEGDNICRAAVLRPGGGVVIGGENYFISTLGGGTPGLASSYALAEVDAVGNVTRQDTFAFFQDLAFPGIYNGISDMVREPADGKLVVTGYAGTSVSNNAPSDVGVIRFNADFSRDSSFGNDGLGLAILSLDGQAGQNPAQREWGSGLALDSRGRIVLIGERSYNISGSNPNDYDWLIARLNYFDTIFRDGLDGVVPN
jgi:uncharacterized delta-60 repeat protein